MSKLRLKNVSHVLQALAIAVFAHVHVNAQGISGNVINLNGEPLPDVTVTAESPSTPPASTTTDDNGSYYFDGISPSEISTLLFNAEIAEEEAITTGQQFVPTVVMQPSGEKGQLSLATGPVSNLITNHGDGQIDRKTTNQPHWTNEALIQLETLSDSELVACLPQELLALLGTEYASDLFPFPLFPQAINLDGKFFCFDTALPRAVLATELPNYNIFYTTDANDAPVVNVEALNELLIELEVGNRALSSGDQNNCHIMPELVADTSGEFLSVTKDLTIEPPRVFTARILETFIGESEDTETGVITREWERTSIFDGINGTDTSETNIRLIDSVILDDVYPLEVELDVKVYRQERSIQTITNSYNGTEFEQFEVTTIPVTSAWTSFQRACTNTLMLSAGGFAVQTQQNLLSDDEVITNSIQLGGRIRAVVGFGEATRNDRLFEFMETIGLDLSNGNVEVSLINRQNNWLERRLEYVLKIVDGKPRYVLQNFLIATQNETW